MMEDNAMDENYGLSGEALAELERLREIDRQRAVEIHKKMMMMSESSSDDQDW